MFDISFSEFILVVVVFVLFVISHYLGTIFKKINHLFFNVKEEIFREETFKKLKKIEKEIFSKNEK
jgi:sec-independent protein translocase protein TatB